MSVLKHILGAIVLATLTEQIKGQSIGQWNDWGACSATCRFGTASPTQTRTRTCTGDCTKTLLEDRRNCNDIACQVIPCVNLDISYIIVIDSSSSVKDNDPDEWSQERTFVKNFAAQLGLGTNPRIRVGVINYGSAVNIVAACDAVETSSLARFNTLIDSLPRQLGGTAINNALLATRSLYTGSGCNRAGELRVVLFLTDGFENIEFNDRIRFTTENLLRSESVIYVGAVGPDVRLPDLNRITRDSSFVRTAANFSELSLFDVSNLQPQILNNYCAVAGAWTSWSGFSSCSISCGSTGIKTRTRECRNPISGVLQNDCPGSSTDSDTCNNGDCVGSWSQWSVWNACSATCHFDDINTPPTEVRTRNCVGATGTGNCGGGPDNESRNCNVQVACPGSWGLWTSFGACSEDCHSNVNNPPTQIRSRTCSGGTFGGGCAGDNSETITCNFQVPCQGSLTQWSLYTSCSATCQQGLFAPTQYRTRECADATFGGDCGGAALNETRDCNVEVSCPGLLSQWGEYDSCSESCQSNVNTFPFQTRRRTCDGPSFGGDCLGQDLSETRTCSVGIGCPGTWMQWGNYGACSATCQDNINIPPMQTRRRTCEGSTFDATCPGQSSETRNCSVGVPCDGSLTQWSLYTSCSATCQQGLFAPTQYRTRECTDATFGGDCGGAALNETRDCNVEVSCPGSLSQWGDYESCSESCQSNVNIFPFQTRRRTCNGPSFGGDCFGQNLSETRTCSVGIGCPGAWTQWGNYDACSATCQDNINIPPMQTRRRTCEGSTFDATCPGQSSETRNCSVGVPCDGSLTQWSLYTSCSATCQQGLFAPTQYRTRECADATFGGDCGGAALNETRDCNVEVSCPGSLSQWGDYDSCSESCQSNVNIFPFQTRRRTCNGPSFGGDCFGQDLSETRTCSVGIGCPGAWTQWGNYDACSATCQDNINIPPMQTRRRTCEGSTFDATCPGQSSETRNCSVGVPCDGSLTQWSLYTTCSATCQQGLFAPTQYRTRECTDATFGGDCGGAALNETRDCNVEVSCPGVLTIWSQWSTCPETCQTGATPAQQTRTRSCENPSFGGNCFDQPRFESRDCSNGIPCPGSLTTWTLWTSCSKSCQLENDAAGTRGRTRQCIGATLTGNCGGAGLSETENCNVAVSCPGRLTNWGPWTDCSQTCQDDPNTSPSESRKRFCVDTSFDGNCNGADLTQSRQCNVGVICPIPGTWTLWSQWSACSKTCDTGIRSRSRTCTDPFPADAGDDCVGSTASTSTCKLSDCPVACPVKKRCNCSLTQQFSTTAPTLAYFNIDDATIHAAINTMSYWTDEIQNQICETCNLQRLQVSVNTVNSHVTQVQNMLTRLNEIKSRLRDIINCNKNVFIGTELWALYDYLYTRCTMLKGIHVELSACQLRFEAANNSCKKFGWFHQLVNQVYRKW